MSNPAKCRHRMTRAINPELNNGFPLQCISCYELLRPGGVAAGAATMKPADTVNHPAHYGGASNPYEAIKVIEAWKLGFNLGNTVKYISRAEHKGASLEDLKKARWYLDREIAAREKDEQDEDK